MNIRQKETLLRRLSCKPFNVFQTEQGYKDLALKLKRMKEKSDTCLFVNDLGILFRKTCPFRVVISSDETEIDGSRTKSYMVKSVAFEDDNMILYEIEGRLEAHVNYQIVFESKVIYLNK